MSDLDKHPSGDSFSIRDRNEQSVHELFEQQAHRAPQSVAVVDEGQQTTYEELNFQANRLARQLRRLGVGPETLVGICAERPLETVVGMLGILKAGGAFLPLDPTYPRARLALLLKDSRAPLLLTEQGLADNLRLPETKILCLDAAWPAIPSSSRADPAFAVGPTNLAYVIYTSGSTGNPKAVAHSHANLVREVERTSRAFSIAASDRLSWLLSPCVSGGVREIFLPLLNGATLLPYRFRTHGFSHMSRWLRGQSVSVCRMAPSLFRGLLGTLSAADGFPLLRLLYIGGETVYAEDFDGFRRHFPAESTFVNVYGASETGIALMCPLGAGDTLPGRTMPVGRPVEDMEVRITNDRGEPAPCGEVGEITVGSCFLARGYWEDPDLTQARFSSDPGRPAWRWYRTGDLGRRLADGNIEFLGRRDEQVKVRGFRVELGEIETALAKHPRVREAVTLARADSPGQQRLVAYVVPRDVSAAPTQSELRAFLEERLPEYMVPATSVVLDRFPLTPSGKVDRRALPAPDGGRPWREGGNVAPRNPLEDQLAGIWGEVLGLDRVGIHDNFFDLGGHSLAAARVAARLEDALQVQVRVRALFETPTIAALAAMIEAGRHGPAPAIPTLRRRSAKRGIAAGRR